MLNIKNSLQKHKATMNMLFASLLTLFAFQATAGSGGDMFQGVFDELISFAEGLPGQIIAFCSFAGVIIFSMVRPNLIGLGVSIVIMIVLSQLNAIITGMLQAGLPV